METAPVQLPCVSEAQAQDQSLALISQGIESTIVTHEEHGGWSLEVAAGDEVRARQCLAAYEAENRTPWRREMRWSGLLFDARAAFCAFVWILFHFLAEVLSRDFTGPGALDRDAVLQGAWWRVFTAMTLHADVAHLLANATIGFVFVGLAMGAYGPGLTCLLALLGGALGNVVSLVAHESPFRNVGASGFVMAALGLLAASSLWSGRDEKRAVWIGRGVIAAGLLVVLLGLSPGSDVSAHVGGFGGGLLLGQLFRRGWTGLAPRPSGALALAGALGLVALTWFLALR